jgi:hypothetical protein
LLKPLWLQPAMLLCQCVAAASCILQPAMLLCQCLAAASCIEWQFLATACSGWYISVSGKLFEEWNMSLGSTAVDEADTHGIILTCFVRKRCFACQH